MASNPCLPCRQFIFKALRMVVKFFCCCLSLMSLNDQNFVQQKKISDLFLLIFHSISSDKRTLQKKPEAPTSTRLISLFVLLCFNERCRESVGELVRNLVFFKGTFLSFDHFNTDMFPIFNAKQAVLKRFEIKHC